MEDPHDLDQAVLLSVDAAGHTGKDGLTVGVFLVGDDTDHGAGSVCIDAVRNADSCVDRPFGAKWHPMDKSSKQPSRTRRTAEQWVHPPFSGAVADGYVWGRGTLDDKGAVLAMLSCPSLYTH